MKTFTVYGRRIALAVLCFISFSAARAQTVTINDTSFAHWLRVKYPACINGNLLDTTCAGIINATVVNCSNKGIRNLDGIQYFDNLQNLDCSYNTSIVLPALRSGLLKLNVSMCGIAVLPALPPTLLYLNAETNYFNSSLVLPAGLEYLNVGRNEMDSLPALPVGLDTLICWDMGPFFNTLPDTLPPGLVHLTVLGHAFPNFPTLPSTLTELWVGFYHGFPFNPFTYTSFSPLPAGLVIFHSVGGTMPQQFLSQFTSLPANLEEFVCEDCGLTSLPQLPNNLQVLNVYNNHLTSIPPFPPSAWMNTILVSKNQLTSIPPIPEHPMMWLDISDNPITCLPPNTSARTFGYANTLLTCLPSYSMALNYSPPAGTLPLCNLMNNPHGCDINWNIGGKAYFDQNNNCAYDAADTTVNNIPVKLRKRGNLVQQMLNGGGSGVYSFDVYVGAQRDTYQISIDTLGLPFQVLCPANGQHTSILYPADSLDQTADFALKCKPGVDLRVRSVASGQFRPGRLAWISVVAGDAAQFYGVQCNTANVSGTVTTTITGPATYVSPGVGARIPSSVNNNVLTYNIADMSTINLFGDFDINLRTDTTAQIGQQVCVTVSITSAVADRDGTNNSFVNCGRVVNSYDPNDKQVYPEGNISSGQDWLTYTIRFQNTGNAPAIDIYIDDTLDSDLDESTFQLLAYSHAPVVQIKDKAVRFNYPNINLPDSTSDEPGSHGFVQYRVKLKQNRPIGTAIENTAFIYFDFNAPVVTNTVVNNVTQSCAVPIASIAGITGFCSDESITLTASGGDTYMWSTGETTASITVTPASTTDYTVTATVTGGCTATASKPITKHPDPTPAISPASPSLCQGESSILTASGGGSYVWSTNASSATITVTPASTTTYTLTVTSGDGCTATTSRTVTVHSNPTPVVSPAAIICAGDSVEFTVSGGDTYAWSDGLGTGATKTVSPVTSTTYTVTVENAAGCSATTHPEVEVNAAPQPVIMQLDRMLTTDNYSSYQWLLDGDTIPNAISQELYIEHNGNYTVIVSTPEGCIATSAVKNVTGVGVGELTMDGGRWTMYPNPATSTVTISIDATMLGSTLTIRDITGKKMTEVHLTTLSQQLNIEHFAHGVYLINVTLKEGGSVTKKLMK